MDRIVATIGIVVQAQLLTAKTTAPEQEISHRMLKAPSSAPAAWHISTPKAPLHIFASIN